MSNNDHLIPVGPHKVSWLRRLEQVVECDAIWEAVEGLDGFHRVAKPNQDRHYNLMDILMVELAACLNGGNISKAVRHLADPSIWGRLSRAAAQTFPNDPNRRLSPKAPSRQQHYRARRNYFSGEALDVLGRGMRAAAVKAAVRTGSFDPNAGTWTHPATSQCVVGDMTFITATADYRHRQAPDSGVVSRFVPGARPGRVAGRELVMLACRNPRGERIVLDAEFMPGDEDRNGRRLISADQAVAILARLLDENGNLLRPGLRGFIHDMTLDSEGIDTLLSMGILPITKVPRQASGRLRRVRLGDHGFTARDGTCHHHMVTAVGGSPVVELSNGSDGVTAIPLNRRHIRWRRCRHRNAAYGEYTLPDSPNVPAHLRGASTVVTLNSTDAEIRGNPPTRRTRALRPIPESDPDFKIYEAREAVEFLFAELKRPAGRGLGSMHDSNAVLRVLAYQALTIAHALRRR